MDSGTKIVGDPQRGPSSPTPAVSASPEGHDSLLAGPEPRYLSACLSIFMS